MGNKGKKNHQHDALCRRITEAIWSGNLRGGNGGGKTTNGGDNSDWDCKLCNQRANWASRSKCRGCGKPRGYSNKGNDASGIRQTGGTGTGNSSTTTRTSSTARTGGDGAAGRNVAGAIRDARAAKLGDGSLGERGGGGKAAGAASSAADDPGDAEHGGGAGGGDEKPGDGDDGEISVAAARARVNREEWILAALLEQGLPKDHELVARAAARVHEAKDILEAAKLANPPPAAALRTVERKVAAALKLEKKAAEAVVETGKAASRARAEHIHAIQARSTAESKLHEMRRTLGGANAAEAAAQQKLVEMVKGSCAEAVRLGTQLEALPGAGATGNGELALRQILQQFTALFGALQSTAAAAGVQPASPLEPVGVATNGAATEETDATAATAASGATNPTPPTAAAAATGAGNGSEGGGTPPSQLPQKKPEDKANDEVPPVFPPAAPPPLAENVQELDEDTYGKYVAAERRQRKDKRKTPEAGDKDGDQSMQEGNGTKVLDEDNDDV